MKVSEAMNKAVTIESDMKLKQVAGIMSDRKIGSLIVLDNEKIAGIITERDILKNVGRLDSKVVSIMSKNVITIDADENINNAALLMAKNKIKRLPVVKKGKLAGIITATDVIANSPGLNESFFFE
jgi:CBS domain-containing protein